MIFEREIELFNTGNGRSDRYGDFFPGTPATGTWHVDGCQFRPTYAIHVNFQDTAV